jgi:tricorn protease
MSLLPPCLTAARLAGLVAALCLLAAPARAAEVKLARHPDYHNGKVVFSYLGDLWTANEDGSHPHRLTVHRSRDVHPRFSPDGKWIAFSSDRYGNYDVFVMPATGGHAKRLTFHSAPDVVVGWTRDSRRILFSSARGFMYPGIPNLYEVPVSGGLEQPALTDWGYWGSYSPDGKKLAFNRHPAVWWRKHYRGSYAADLWVLDVAQNKFRRLLDNDTPDEEKANNFWPMYAPGGSIYFVSDRDVRAKSGSPAVMKSVNNIWKVSEEGGDPVQVTHHKSGVFWPSLSADGKTIVYEEGFGLWRLDLASGKTAPIKLDITSDDQENNLETVVVHNEADAFHLSPSAKRAVISVRGELFTIATEKGDIRRLTHTPRVREGQPQWSPDGKWIAFVSDKAGGEQVWLCDERGGRLRRVSTGDSQKAQLRWAPHGRSLLYTASDNKLYRYDLDTDKTTALAKSEVAGFGEMSIGNPQWSPDARWVSYHKADRTLLPHVYVIPAGGGPERRITDADTYSDADALWTPDGKHIVYLAGRDVGNLGQGGRSAAQIYSVALLPETADPADKGIDSEEQALLQKPAADGKPQLKIGPDGKAVVVMPPKLELKIDFTNIGRRARQLTKTGDAITALTLAPNARAVTFATSGTEGGRPVLSVWTQTLDGDKLVRVAQGTQTGPEDGSPRPPLTPFTSLQFNKDGRTLFLKQGSGIYAITVAPENALAAALGAAKGPAAGAPPPPAQRRLTFTARVDIDRRALYRQVFHESWRVMKHRFYAEDMHGVDWDKMKAVYQPLLAHVADREELHDVINQMIGELNASHTGVSTPPATAAQTETRSPGFELQPDQSGYYKVTHVYKRGPADKDYVKVRVGDYVLGIDGQALRAGDNYWRHYTASPGSKMEFILNDKPGTVGAWKTTVRPVSPAELATLQYEKWVAERRALVARLSGGQFGYLHIRQMNEPALRKFERDLVRLSTKQALVIDQRFNPGGNIDQELLQILGQRQYQKTRLRNSVHVTRPLRGFFGPMVVMANERSTSDAEVFPDGFRTLKLGKVVGVTTYGAVIGTGAHQLMDGSVLRTPSTGLWNVNGTNLENSGVRPDVYVENTPKDFFRGRDAQLEKAVEVLRQELAQRK